MIYPQFKTQQPFVAYVCSKNGLAEALALDKVQKSKEFEEKEKKIPFYIRVIMARDWTKNLNFLQTIEDPSIWRMPHIQLAPLNEEHWAVRAISNGSTLLNYEELLDFLTIVSPSTFGLFEV